ncbi:methyltransferase, FxLD system [Streptomyces abikoensis]|uniref:Protein-L-isoaspartate O-methyltransferase n=1 Tax=Streptomyces abikoensis TaxID=97398 RepID=A0ABW7T4T9_9ACTN
MATPWMWHQHQITFADQTTAVQIAARDLMPALEEAREAGLLTTWWFVRKQPWRLRYLSEFGNGIPAITHRLDALASAGPVTTWNTGIYEPEIRAFGGAEGMDIAHDFFHDDSRHLLTRATDPTAARLGPRETAIVLCSAMLRAAGLDWYEQGDVWAKVADLRPAHPEAPNPERASRLAEAMRRLMTANARHLCDPARNGPLVNHAGWIDSFERTGRCLAELAQHGRLDRGLRAVLAHHVIFHANRAGLPSQDQSALAATALNAVFATDGPLAFSSSYASATTKVRPVTTLRDDHPDLSADQLRDQLTDRLRSQKVLRSPAAEEAFRATPRHLFLPGVPLEQAYADNPVYTKTTTDGTSISAASQPWIVAMMIEQLDAQPGERIMEIGAGTGYNAALMAAIVGESGHVTTIDVDEDLVAGARAHLAAADIKNVTVVLEDGALGHPDGAPYDRVIATVGAYEVPGPWLDQLAPGGRLVVPLRLRGTASRSIVFERAEDGWRSRASQLAVFMPLRGIGDDARRIVPLTPEGDVTLQVHKDQDVSADALANVLAGARHEEWTGVHFPAETPFEWMDLWLCLALPNGLMRMNAPKDAAARAGLSPMFGWGSMATTSGADLAYLRIRTAPPAPDGTPLYEVGVVAHGPTGPDLADKVAQQVKTWDTRYRHRDVRFEISDTPKAPEPAAGRFVLDRPNHPITVIWE